MLVGLTLACGTPTPLPDSATVALGALLEMVTVAARDPTAAGVNVTANVQLDPAATVTPAQVSEDFGKSPELAPPTETVEMIRFAVPVLDTVTVVGALDWP